MPCVVILSEGQMPEVETRRANGGAVWISRKSELSLKNNGILNLLSVRSDRLAVALRVSTTVSALRRPPLKMTHGGDVSEYRTGEYPQHGKQTDKLPFADLCR